MVSRMQSKRIGVANFPLKQRPERELLGTVLCVAEPESLRHYAFRYLWHDGKL